MTLQVIKDLKGADEYVLVPIKVFDKLRREVRRLIVTSARCQRANDDYLAFNPSHYVDHPVVLARLRAGLTQAELAAKLGVGLAVVKRAEVKAFCSITLLASINGLTNFSEND